MVIGSISAIIVTMKKPSKSTNTSRESCTYIRGRGSLRLLYHTRGQTSVSLWNVPLADIDLSDDEIRAVTDVLRSKWLSMGPVTADFFFFQAEDGIRDYKVTGVQTCALPISGGQRLIVLCALLS